MGKTFRRNDRFKKDRRDRNFKQSKKFKERQNNNYGPVGFPQPRPDTEIQKIEGDGNDTFDSY